MDLLNFNIGVLGHVDSGKTSLSKAISTVGSTASFDKNPQSVERGITLDLGFSSFIIDTPNHLKSQTKANHIQITLVDCPGHASLIRTIIGGAQIMDAMILVVDAVKGFQTQTAECLVIGEITCDKILVVLNKVDLYPVEKRDAMVEKMKKKLRLTLQKTKFKDAPIVPVSAKPGSSENTEPIGVAVLTYAALLKVNRVPYYKQEVPTKAKMHITIGHETCMAKVSFFGYYGSKDAADAFDFNAEYLYQDTLLDVAKLAEDSANDTQLPSAQFCLLEFEKPIYVIPRSLTIASKFDTDIHSNICRLAFHGNLLEIFDSEQYRTNSLPKLKVYKMKKKEGIVERVVNEQEMIVKNLLKKETNVNLFTGLKVKLSTGEEGFIEGSFGQSGKVKVRIPGCILPETQARFKGAKKKGKENVETEPSSEPVIVLMNFKRFVFDPQKRMIQ